PGQTRGRGLGRRPHRPAQHRTGQRRAAHRGGAGRDPADRRDRQGPRLLPLAPGQPRRRRTGGRPGGSRQTAARTDLLRHRRRTPRRRPGRDRPLAPPGDIPLTSSLSCMRGITALASRAFLLHRTAPTTPQGATVTGLSWPPQASPAADLPRSVIAWKARARTAWTRHVLRPIATRAIGRSLPCSAGGPTPPSPETEGL